MWGCSCWCRGWWCGTSWRAGWWYCRWQGTGKRKDKRKYPRNPFYFLKWIEHIYLHSTCQLWQLLDVLNQRKDGKPPHHSDNIFAPNEFIHQKCLSTTMPTVDIWDILLEFRSNSTTVLSGNAELMRFFGKDQIIASRTMLNGCQ